MDSLTCWVLMARVFIRLCVLAGLEWMDSLTLSLIIIVFLSSLALYFATASPMVIPPTPLPEKPPVVALAIKIPAVLRQNVAVARLIKSGI